MVSKKAPLRTLGLVSSYLLLLCLHLMQFSCRSSKSLKDEEQGDSVFCQRHNFSIKNTFFIEKYFHVKLYTLKRYIFSCVFYAFSCLSENRATLIRRGLVQLFFRLLKSSMFLIVRLQCASKGCFATCIVTNHQQQNTKFGKEMSSVFFLSV